MPVIRKTVDTRVLTHGRNTDAISQPDVAQLERREEMRGLILRDAKEESE
jgi:hypothetical protein